MARLLVETSALPWHKVPEDMRENFIFTGYRPASMGIFRSLRSAFLLHNETLNIWTHMLPVFYFLYFLWLDAEMWIEMDLPHDQRFPLYGYILGICILFGTSGCAHWLNCVSWHWRHVFFMLDYGAISVYGVATAVAYYFYSHSKTPMISQGTGYFLPLTVGAAIFATWLCCWTRVNHSLVPNVCHIVRTLAFGLPFLVGSLPAIVRFLGPYLATIDTSVLPSHMQQTIANHSHLTHNDDLTFQHHYVRHFVLLLIGAFIHMAKIPERWFPGLFDIFGHSHQWFHLFVFLSIREQFWLVIWDIRDSRQAGALFTTSSTLSTLVVYAVLVVMVMATIAWFSQYTGDEEPLPGEHAACCCSRRPSCNSEQVDNKTSQCGCKHDSVIVDKTKSVRRRDIVQKRKNPGAKATAQNSSAVIAANGEENGDLVLREDGGESCCPCNPQVRRRTCTQECCSYPI